jgi:hypothetical protein
MTACRRLLLAGLLTVSGALTARALPTPEGVRWSFDATVTQVSTSLGATAAVQVGDHLSGSLNYYSDIVQNNGYTGHAAEVRISIPNGSVLHFIDFDPSLVDGAPYVTPDSLIVSAYLLNPGAILSLQPDYQFDDVNDPSGQLSLSNTLGNAWSAPLNPRDPLLIPDYAPESGFLSPYGSNLITLYFGLTQFGAPAGSASIALHIDSFPLPEPGLSGLVLVGLALLRRRAAGELTHFFRQ